MHFIEQRNQLKRNKWMKLTFFDKIILIVNKIFSCFIFVLNEDAIPYGLSSLLFIWKKIYNNRSVNPMQFFPPAVIFQWSNFCLVFLKIEKKWSYKEIKLALSCKKCLINPIGCKHSNQWLHGENDPHDVAQYHDSLSFLFKNIKHKNVKI